MIDDGRGVPETVEDAIETVANLRAQLFNAAMAAMRAELTAMGYPPELIEVAYEIALAGFGRSVLAEAQQLNRDLEGVLPRRGPTTWH